MDLISTISSTLGVDAQTAQGAVGSVLGLIKQQAPAETFAAVEDKVPEANSWMAAAPAEAGASEGGLGDILGGLAGSLGLGSGAPAGGGGGGGLGGVLGQLGGLAGLAGVISSLSKLGLNAESLGKLVPVVLQFLRARLGDGGLAKLLAAVPALAQLGQGTGAGAAGSDGEGSSSGPLGGLGGLFK